MLSSILGKKIGMTQVFTGEGKVLPVTVINAANWFVTQIKTVENDGYTAVQIGLLKNKFESSNLNSAWIKNKNQYCSLFREVPLDVEHLDSFKVGQAVGLDRTIFAEKDKVKVTGKSKGHGFQGVIKRWGFGGGPGGHGSNFHRAPGSIGNMCSQGKVVKGKKLPGQQGNKVIATKGLEIVKIDKDSNVLFVKGAVPGKKESLILISKQG